MDRMDYSGYDERIEIASSHEWPECVELRNIEPRKADWEAIRNRALPEVATNRVDLNSVEGRIGPNIFWRSDLSGPDGAYFTLWAKPEATLEEIRAAKAEIRRTQDCTGLYVHRPKVWRVIDFAAVEAKV